MKNKTINIALAGIILASTIIPADVTASELQQCSARKIVEPNMIGTGRTCDNTPWVKFEMGNAAGNSRSRLRYRVGTSAWHYLQWKGICGKTATYNLIFAKKTKVWSTEVQRVRAKDGRILESLYI